MPRPYNTSLTPEQLRERARNAALTRTTLDHHVRAIVDRAPMLTAEQAERLRALLPVSRSEGDSA